MDLKDHIRSVPDFPKPGILFYDISTLLAHPDAWQVALGRMAKCVGRHQPDILAGIDARGFLVAAPPGGAPWSWFHNDPEKRQVTGTNHQSRV